MTDTLVGVSPLRKAGKKTLTPEEAERAAVRELVKAARARGEDLTGPDLLAFAKIDARDDTAGTDGNLDGLVRLCRTECRVTIDERLWLQTLGDNGDGCAAAKT